jgi:hypothetical protein
MGKWMEDEAIDRSNEQKNQECKNGRYERTCPGIAQHKLYN